MSARTTLRPAIGGDAGLHLDVSRRRVLQLGLGATAGLLAGPQQASAQNATPAAMIELRDFTDEERGWLERASRNDVNGWMHVRIQGAPFARGFQYGYLTAAEYAEAIRVYTAMTYQTMGMDYSFFVEKAAEYHKTRSRPS